MVRIRLRRGGRKKAPVYRLVVADSRSPRDGKFIEIIGQYSPRQSETGMNINVERALYWLGVGAQPSDTARSLLRKAGVMKTRHEQMLARKLNAAAVPVTEQQAAAAPSAAVPVVEERAAEDAAAEG
ncbi:MAG: 30S ribosomal protein S16 [Gemmatimonadaceae bacterium]